MRLPRHVKGRLGYTTGACAAAALKGALLALKQRPSKEVIIKLPAGMKASFVLHYLAQNGDTAEASVIKDAGDDPDVTHGAEIRVRVRQKPGRGNLYFRAGEGVGVVTKPGLGLPVGEPAITKIPRLMMFRVAEEILGEELGHCDLEITVSIPGGEELARHTLNARLGIKGGLSILGTKGIVIPYSTAAYKATIAKSFLVARALKISHLVLTTGGRTEAFAMKLFPSLPEESFVQIGDYVGFALKTARALGFSETTFVMMIGKLTKVAAGLPQTHAKHGEVPLSLLRDLAAESGCPGALLDRISQAHTARGFLENLTHLAPQIVWDFGQRLCQKAVESLLKMIQEGPLAVEVVLLDFEGLPLAQSRGSLGGREKVGRRSKK